MPALIFLDKLKTKIYLTNIKNKNNMELARS